MAQIREIVARGRRAPQTVIANGDNEGQWLKRDLYGQLKSGVLGDTFSRASGPNFVGSDLKDSIPSFNLPATGHSPITSVAVAHLFKSYPQAHWLFLMAAMWALIATVARAQDPF